MTTETGTEVRPSLSTLMSLGGNLAIASALGGLAATVMQMELTVRWDLLQIVVVCGALLLSILWAYLALILCWSQFHYSGSNPKRRILWTIFEFAFYFIALPITLVPFFVVHNERMVARCDQWWSGQVIEDPNPNGFTPDITDTFKKAVRGADWTGCD